MTDVPQWAVERARELAALWNDPGQADAIARALAEAAKPNEALVCEAQFLTARLRELEPEFDEGLLDASRAFFGHVLPALSRLEKLISSQRCSDAYEALVDSAARSMVARLFPNWEDLPEHTRGRYRHLAADALAGIGIEKPAAPEVG